VRKMQQEREIEREGMTEKDRERRAKK